MNTPVWSYATNEMFDRASQGYRAGNISARSPPAQDLLAQDVGSGQHRLQNCCSGVTGGIPRNPGLVSRVQFRRGATNELRDPARGRGRVPIRCLSRQLRRRSVHTHRLSEGELDPACNYRSP